MNKFSYNLKLWKNKLQQNIISCTICNMLQIHIDSTTKQVRYNFLNENIYQVTKGFIQKIIFMKKLF
jgi:hypothetical protein